MNRSILDLLLRDGIAISIARPTDTGALILTSDLLVDTIRDSIRVFFEVLAGSLVLRRILAILIPRDVHLILKITECTLFGIQAALSSAELCYRLIESIGKVGELLVEGVNLLLSGQRDVHIGKRCPRQLDRYPDHVGWWRGRSGSRYCRPCTQHGGTNTHRSQERSNA